MGTVTWMKPGEESALGGERTLEGVRARMAEAASNYRYLMQQIAYGGSGDQPAEPAPGPAPPEPPASPRKTRKSPARKKVTKKKTP